ncbi:MucBP domain-containing protein [Enterococcus faecalis]
MKKVKIFRKSVSIVMLLLLSLNVFSVIVYAGNSAERTVTVEPKDFLTYFQRNGSAANFEYDENSWIQTLTPDNRSQSGNVTLKTKVDMSQNFKFEGYVNLGNKSMSKGGADGIGFMFHPGDTNVVGAPGNGMGIGNVEGAFGFKLDTYYNSESTSEYSKDPSKYNNKSFGAFVDGRNGVATTVEDGSKIIKNPLNNEFLPFSIEYIGATKTMNISYDNVNWSMDISSFLGDESYMSFAIVASTGYFTNLQQLKNIVFTYTIAQGRVIAKYVDELGVPLSEEILFQDDIGIDFSTKEKDINGYVLKQIEGTTDGKFTPNDQIVTYVYSKIPSETVPSETAPSETVPSETVPSETVPSETVPSETVPSETVPSETVPSETVPSETVPSETVPSETVPSETAPSETVPSETVPSETVPSETAPSETVPSETVPSETVPSETVPSETVPSETVPSETVPSETVPSETVPSETVPSETVPSETVPNETVPSETVPSETAPSETVPSETVPSETAPSETVPSETVPSETEESISDHKFLSNNSNGSASNDTSKDKLKLPSTGQDDNDLYYFFTGILLITFSVLVLRKK